jgi:crotonobetainyl-CoA:carnitine CoA-transferase CaiB-like acyl-CoA transferase
MFSNLNALEAELPEYARRPPDAPLALAGMRVVDFSHFIAGPYCTMLLADFGADVIKIEPPGKGDDFRNYPPTDPALPGRGAPFFFTNRNKRSVAVDLKVPSAIEAVKRMIAGADILVENFSSGVMQRLGLDYDACKRLNPRLVYCSISAYGRDGEFADRLGFDAVVQAESGFMSLTGYPDREGVRSLAPVMDIGTALMACNTILAAIVARGSSGKGQLCEVALFDSALAMVGYAPYQYLLGGVEPRRVGNVSPDTSPAGIFKASDASFYVNCANDKLFARLFKEVLCLPEVATDPRFKDRAGRIAHRDALSKLMDEAFARQPWAHWREKFRQIGVPAGEVRGVAQSLRSPEAQARGLVTRIPHPQAGWAPHIVPPPRMSGTPVADPVPAPALGEHTREVLREFGWAAQEIDEMARTGVFGPV